MPFTHLRTRSYYSFLRATLSPKELAQAAYEQGMPAIGLTDFHSLSGAVEFYDASREVGVKPLIGMELTVEMPAGLDGAGGGAAPLALLALDLEGWRSLCRLSSFLLAGEGGELPSLPFERLADEARGLLCLAGGCGGMAGSLISSGRERAAANLLSRLAEVFPDRLYLDLHIRTENDERLCRRMDRLANRLKLPVTAAQPVHYLLREQAELGRLLAGMRLNLPISDVPEEACPPANAHFAPAEEMVQRFTSFSGALEGTLEIAERCSLELPLGKPRFPHWDLPPGESEVDLLRARAEAGAVRLYGGIDARIRQRLEHELEIIGGAGYASLFLVMEEVLQYTRQVGAPSSSRGSAASSLVAHCLGITSPDPIRLDLYFERFLNPARAAPSDIDTDLCSRRRDEVIDFVYRRFGQERVAMVCTVNRFRRRSALREAAKAYGLSSSEVKSLADSLPYRGWGPPSVEGGDEPYAGLKEKYPDRLHQEIFRHAQALLGLPHHLSIHPGGVVIGPGPLADLVPLSRASKGVVITQFDLGSIARMGLVKLDLLGIRGLTVLGDLAQAVHKTPAYQAKITIHRSTGNPLDVLESIPEDCPHTAERVRTGGTIGCFQIESPGMRATLKEIQADSVDDVMAALALYRPGPLTGGLKTAFVRRFRGDEPVSHIHPTLAPLLEETYGVILYQEQVLRIAHELAGLSLAEADLLRWAMSHFDPGKQMRTLQDRFVAGAWKTNRVPADTANRVWEMMAAFAGYGFPKAHAASYALVAWRAAWCKTHFPALFMAAVLANWGGYYSQQIYLTEVRRLGLGLRPPHVNHSRREFSVSWLEGEPVLFMGLDQVRDLTRRAQKRILRERPFHSLDDFLSRIDPRPKEAENLARAGALEGFGPAPFLLRRIKTTGWHAGQLPLFSLAEQGEDGEWTLKERAEAQQAVLGVSVDVHPLELAANMLEGSEAISTVEAAARVGERVRVAGMRQWWRRSRTREDTIYLMAFEDLEGMLDVVIPAEMYRKCRTAIRGAGPYLVEGVVELNPVSGEPFIRATNIEKI
jgi:DNA polymerase III subunit alpha